MEIDEKQDEIVAMEQSKEKQRGAARLMSSEDSQKKKEVVKTTRNQSTSPRREILYESMEDDVDQTAWVRSPKNMKPSGQAEHGGERK